MAPNFDGPKPSTLICCSTVISARASPATLTATIAMAHIPAVRRNGILYPLNLSRIRLTKPTALAALGANLVPFPLPRRRAYPYYRASTTMMSAQFGGEANHDTCPRVVRCFRARGAVVKHRYQPGRGSPRLDDYHESD